MKGTVNFFSTQGWGFIKGDDKQDYYVHHTGIATDETFKMLMKNEVVEFDIQPTDKPRPMAVNVKVTRVYKNEEKANADRSI